MNIASEDDLKKAARLIAESKNLIAFTGAGISVESGVPTFRGNGGLWEKMDPSVLQIDRFDTDPAGCWSAIRDIFYAKLPSGLRPSPNKAHLILAAWEKSGILAFLVTQNIDGLHSLAGSRKIAEFHGSTRELLCRRCGRRVAATPEALGAGLLDVLPPRCPDCSGILKPDFVFFGEGIPSDAYSAALAAAESADVCLVVGSTGVVYPAAQIPILAKRSGASVIEIDPGETEFSGTITDIHIRLGASEALSRLDELLHAQR
jgi:NAD-dependent deacetylase